MSRAPVLPRRAATLLALPALLGMLVSVISVALASPARAVADELWFATRLHLPDAHRLSTGAGVVVGLVDGGVDATAPSLVGQIVPGIGLGPDASRDGMRDDDPEGHGTSMAGLIAGSGRGFEGVAPGARVLPVSTGRRASAGEVARGIVEATDRGARVINLSLGAPGLATAQEKAAVGYAVAHDVVVVAAAGNVDEDDTEPLDHQVNSPANIPGVIAVTGLTEDDSFWEGSAAGPAAVLAAPATAIPAPVPNGFSPSGVETADGTSNSTAIVSGVVALVRARHPGLSAAAVIDLLVRTADDLGPRGRDPRFGYGVVDPVEALTVPARSVAENPLLTAPLATSSSPLAADEDALAAVSAPPPVTASGTVPVGAAWRVPASARWLLALTGAVVAGGLLGIGAAGLRRAARRRVVTR